MPIEFSDVRYIKLGPAGAWNDISLSQNELHLKFCDVPHELAQSNDEAAIAQIYIDLGHTPGAATTLARQVLNFYNPDSRRLWITFAHQHLWWTFADPQVEWLGGDGIAHGCRKRLCVERWSNLDVNGQSLTIDRLAGHLTQVTGFMGAICRVQDEDYLRRRLNGWEDPIQIEARSATATVLDVLGRAITRLQPSDLELMVDLIFARSGWQRVSALGGNQEFIDLALENPVTDERLAVQVKCEAGQAELNDYIARYDAAGIYSRLFFIYHSPANPFVAPDREDIHIWHRQKLAQITLRSGLADWVWQKLL